MQDKKVVDTTLLPATQDAQPPALIGGVNVQALINKALEKDSPLEVLKELAVLEEKIHARQAKEAFNASMAAFQAECPPIPKGKTARGKKFDYNYAPLPLILATVRVCMERHGLSHAFHVTEQTKETITVVCEARHSGGHSESCQFTAPIDPEAYMNEIQKVGSSMTYGERYTFCAVFGIAPGDDDGKASDPVHAAGEHPASKRRGRSKSNVINGHPYPACPNCDNGTKFVNRSKFDGKEYYCYKKLGGCGHQFDATHVQKVTAPTEPQPDDFRASVRADVFDADQGYDEDDGVPIEQPAGFEGDMSPDDRGVLGGPQGTPTAAPDAPGPQHPDEVDTLHPQDAGLCSAKQVKALRTLQGKCGISDAAYHRDLKKQYDAASTKDLTSKQASETYDALQTMLAQREAAEKAARQDADKI